MEDGREGKLAATGSGCGAKAEKSSVDSREELPSDRESVTTNITETEPEEQDGDRPGTRSGPNASANFPQQASTLIEQLITPMMKQMGDRLDQILGIVLRTTSNAERDKVSADNYPPQTELEQVLALGSAGEGYMERRVAKKAPSAISLKALGGQPTSMFSDGRKEQSAEQNLGHQGARASNAVAVGTHSREEAYPLYGHPEVLDRGYVENDVGDDDTSVTGTEALEVGCDRGDDRQHDGDRNGHGEKGGSPWFNLRKSRDRGDNMERVDDGDAEDKGKRVMQKRKADTPLFQQAQKRSSWNEDVEGLLAAVRLPTLQLPEFVGDDEVGFRDFMEDFERYIAYAKVPEDYKLQALLQACKCGRVRRVITPCTKRGPVEGYQRALRLLKERFGDDDAYAASLTRKVLTGPDIRLEDSKSLKDFSDDLWSAVGTLTEMGMKNELDTQSHVEIVAKRFTGELHKEYCKAREKYRTKYGRNPRMEWLVSFVQRQARCAVGRERSEQELAVRKTLSIKRAVGLMVKEEGSTYASYIQQQSCPLCDSRHVLTMCEGFRKMDVLQRRNITRQLGYCFGCLKGGHMITNCRTASRCNIDNCNDRHSRWLHVTTGPKGGARTVSYPMHGATIYKPTTTSCEPPEQQGPSTSCRKGASTDSKQWSKGNVMGTKDEGEIQKGVQREAM